jgi:hypothetical protein
MMIKIFIVIEILQLMVLAHLKTIEELRGK